MGDLSFVWLEITGRCQLTCEHCYAASGPTGSHGTMTEPDWLRVIDEAADLGVGMVQFIGGEPTTHPALPRLIRYALGRGVEVEVFSNLFHISTALWEVLSLPGVRLATSYYSDDADEHEAITHRPTSHARTTANIAEAVRRGIPLRTGVIDVRDGQRVEAAREQLHTLGVRDIGSDRLRQVGRGVRDVEPSVEQLCGNCASGVLAVSPDGTVWPCVFSRWLPVGNVREESLRGIVEGSTMTSATGQLNEYFEARRRRPTTCPPGGCQPDCGPRGCGPNACDPVKKCDPKYKCSPCAPEDRLCSPEVNCDPNKCRPTGRR